MTIDKSDMPRSKTFPDRDVIKAIQNHEDPFVTVSDVAEAIGENNSTVHKRLVSMVEDGKIKRRDVGASAVIWWIPDESSN